jgi:hypothetical protein
MPTRIEKPKQKRLPRAAIDAWSKVTSAVAADQLGGRAHVDARIRPIRPLNGARLVAMPSPPGASPPITARCIMRSP